jgi:UDP-N-acetylmuramyl pentapeptide phosphotransferase/UDP-N-acetylglucosamine-1-phosphate transferase
MLGGLGAIAWAHQDALVLYLCLTGIGATLGFLLLNYPFGRIFLGDGGAYLAGFWVAECAVLLLVRNPNVSTWGPLLVCFYPVWETGFSMYRRSFIRKTHSGKPDMVHFHHLLLRRFVSRHLEAQQPAWIRHAWTSALLWGFVLVCQLLAVIANAQSMLLGIGALAFGVLYLRTYSALVHACQPASGLLGISDDVYVEPNVEPSLYVDQR